MLRSTNAGCHIAEVFIGCIMYADDLILLSPCVAGLQNMLDVCTVGPICNEFDIVFNAKKCMFMVVGKCLMRTQASDITVCISGVAITYVQGGPKNRTNFKSV